MVQRTLAIQSCLPRDAQKSSPAFSWNKDCRICDCYDPPAPLFTPTSPVSFGFDRIAHEASGYIAESHLSPTALERVREIIGAAKASLPSRTGLMISAKTGTDTPAVVLHQPADAPPNERNPCLRAGPLHVVSSLFRRPPPDFPTTPQQPRSCVDFGCRAFFGTMPRHGTSNRR
jgi:hypothetical protein